MGWNPVKEAEKKAKQAVDKVIKPAVKAAESSIKSVGREAEKAAEESIKKVRHDAYWAVRKEGERRVGEVGQAGKKALAGVEDAVGDAVEDALQAFAAAIGREGLKKFRNTVRSIKSGMDDFANKYPDLVDQVDVPGVTLELGPATLEWSGFYSRADGLTESLDHYINDPPKFRRGPFLELVESLGPDTVDLGLSVNFALVVGSKELGIGGNVSALPLKLFTKLADAALAELGVPE